MKYVIIVSVDRREKKNLIRKDSIMTKIKIAAVIACMLATGAFAGFTYQAANHNSENEKVTVSKAAEAEDEIVTDEETTCEEVTDEESTAEETTAEETVPAVAEKMVKKEDAKVEKKKKEKDPAVTAAPEAEPVPETITEVIGYYEAPAEEYYEEDYYYYEYYEPETYWEPESEPEIAEEPAEEYPEEDNGAEEVTDVPEEEAPAEQTPEVTEPAPEPESNGRVIQVTDAEYIWLCNVVGHEYGANWISEYEKAKVVEVIMNRVNDPRFPNTIWGVLTQPYQFSGLEWTLYLGTYSYQVTDSVKAAVDLYLEHPEQFQHGYLGFWGDGRANHFYSI